MNLKSPLLCFCVLLALTFIFAAFGPAESTLGTNVRVVYLHGAWVWASLAAFISAGAVGLAALVARRAALHAWSRALGRTGLVFWISYLPLSLWAMQTNWNGLFLAEPRWRFALIFSVSGILLQWGLSFLPLVWSSVGNIAYVIALFWVLAGTENVLHPPGPMFESDFGRIQLFFISLTLILIFTAFQVARAFLMADGKRSGRDGAFLH